MVFHPDGTHAFVVNEFTDSVTVYAYTQETGLLAAQETVSTIPTEFPGDDNTCADVHVTPDGAFLYASNRGHDSLAMFAIDSRTKALTSLGQVPTEPRPREFEVDPLGRFVYAAGQDSGQLASYAIEDDGTLTALEVYAAEPQPLWVLAVGILEKP
jgi:6-phosphogluconolactonase